MFKNRSILVLGVLSMLLVAIAIPESFVSTLPLEELSWPPRPILIPATDANSLSDYHERHPEWVSSDPEAAVPVTGISDLSDYYLRHPELNMPVDAIADTSDHFLRHPELRAPVQSEDITDYFLRHPELNVP